MIFRLELCFSILIHLFYQQKSQSFMKCTHMYRGIGDYEQKNKIQVSAINIITLVGRLTGLTTSWCRNHQEPRLLHDRPPPPPPQWQESACTRGSCCAWTEEFKRSASQKIMRSFQPWQPAFKAGGVASVESGCVTSREHQLQNKIFFQRLTRFCSGACVGHLRPASVLDIDAIVNSTHSPAGQLGKGRHRWGSCRWSTRPPSESPGPGNGQIGKWKFRFEVRWLAKGGDLDACNRHWRRPYIVLSVLDNDYTLRNFLLNVEMKAHNPDKEWGDDIHLEQLVEDLAHLLLVVHIVPVQDS